MSIYKKVVSNYFKLMKDVIKEVGPHRVVQVVTDNEKAIKQAGKKLKNIFLIFIGLVMLHMV